MTKRNECLNLLKCAACFGVVFIHVPFPGYLGDVIKSLSLFAFPLFYMIAGYYSYGCDYEKIKRRFIKICKIFVFGYVLHFAFYLLMAVSEGTTREWFSENFGLKSIVLFFVFCIVKFSVPLWYLIAMAETYLFWMIVTKTGKQDKAVRFTYVLLLAGAVLTTVLLSKEINNYSYIFIFRALPWFMLGYLFKSKYEAALKGMSNVFILIPVIIGWLISTSSNILDLPVKYHYVGVLVTAPAIFLIGIKNSGISIPKSISYIGDKLSLFIYIIHLPVSLILIFVESHMGINDDSVILYIHPLLTLVVTIIGSAMLELIFRNEKLRKLIY